MANHTRAHPTRVALTAVLVAVALTSCAIQSSSAPPGSASPKTAAAEMKMQALVMSMADDHIASLGEAIYLLTRSRTHDPKARSLAQYFLRNGVGASLDIAVGPNPPVSLLDLLVLTSLQAWSFEVHWIPAGIGEDGIPALARLKRAETDAWTTAKKILSDDQLGTLRGLIRAWISANPDRTVVALTRFNDFADERRMSSASLRGEARGLLREVSEASAAVEDVRLLGERLLWFAGRYPHLLGQQAELTAYRLIDQPEVSQLTEAVKAVQRLSDVLSTRLGTIQSDLKEQQTAVFSKLSAERTAAINQLQTALDATVKMPLDNANKSITIQRDEAIKQFFDRFAQERSRLLDDISSRQNELRGVMTDLRQTIAVSGTLASELTGTVNAIDRVVRRFSEEPGSGKEPLRLTDIRDAAIETGNAANRVTHLLERANELLESTSWNRAISTMTDPADEIIDRVFWRGVILICLLIAGLGLLRLVPQRIFGR